ncbi:MAG: Unknown protein [uncultured Aureispira sp.]|uniref:Uncharacterized protein n=1 Tax=uncultured Aureispira sp. TaxID=1331704 RepID=A0A6S6RZE7_9BACT|nr:MAG: Unknown protein [uncultured Aureispira sp.]
MNMKNELMSIEDVNVLINLGRVLVLAGDEALFAKLDVGNWIGGTIPCFMGENGGEVNYTDLFVTDFTNTVTNFSIKAYDAGEITTTMLRDRYSKGFSYLLLPAFSEVHQSYALNTRDAPTLFDVPMMGWITGVHLDNIATKPPKVINGKTGVISGAKGLVLHCELNEGTYAEVDIVNIYEQRESDKITFQEDSFSCSDCLINGVPANLADYYKKHKIDVSLPLVANYSGASINVSIEAIDEEEKRVSFFAPVLRGQEYSIAKPIDDLYATFSNALPQDISDSLCSCNCILNYANIKMENKLSGDYRGPFTFGEIAYVLVNQTLVTLSINNLND